VLLNLHNSALQKSEFYCCRSNSAEILSLLMLDNAYENYIKNILELDQKLKLQPTLESIMIYLYEIQGYFKNIDVSKIFRLMLK
jgi:exportin-7